MEPASLFREKTPSEQRSLTVFRAEIVGLEDAIWREQLSGFDRLKAITYSSGLYLILELTGMFKDVEVTLGSDRILSREHAALEQASHIAKGYTLVDALADQKHFWRALPRQFGPGLLPRIAKWTLSFRLFRQMPSHEKVDFAGENTWDYKHAVDGTSSQVKFGFTLDTICPARNLCRCVRPRIATAMATPRLVGLSILGAVEWSYHETTRLEWPIGFHRTNSGAEPKTLLLNEPSRRYICGEERGMAHKVTERPMWQ